MDLFDEPFLAVWLPYVVCMIPTAIGLFLITKWEIERSRQEKSMR